MGCRLDFLTAVSYSSSLRTFCLNLSKKSQGVKFFQIFCVFCYFSVSIPVSRTEGSSISPGHTRIHEKQDNCLVLILISNKAFYLKSVSDMPGPPPSVRPGLPSGQTAAPAENHPRGAMFPRGGWPFMRKPGQKLSTLLIVRSASGYYKTARSARDRKGKDFIGNPYHLPFRNARTSGRAGTEGAAPGRVTAMALARVARVRGSRPQSSPRMPRRK